MEDDEEVDSASPFRFFLRKLEINMFAVLRIGLQHNFNKNQLKATREDLVETSTCSTCGNCARRSSTALVNMTAPWVSGWQKANERRGAYEPVAP